MCDASIRRRLVFTAAYCLVVAAASSTEGVEGGKQIPPISEIRRTVLDYFEDQEDYRPGDMITREQIEPLLERLREKGLPLPDAKEILDSVPEKGEFLVDQLGTPAGRKFMRRIARFPEAYDRLDRLGRLPRGKRTVADLIRDPGGYKMIEYMTTAAGGKELGRMLSNSPKGKNFNRPTGRTYTAELLLERLERSRAESIKAAEKKAAR